MKTKKRNEVTGEQKKNEAKKKHAENYLQWQWCNSDNEIRITTHWRKLNLHFFTINCERGRLVSGRYSCDMNMKQEPPPHTYKYNDKTVNRLKRRKKNCCIQKTKTNILYIFVPFHFLSLTQIIFFSRFLFTVCCTEFFFSFWNSEWRVMMRWYTVIVMLCESNMKTKLFEKPRKRVDITNTKKNNGEWYVVALSLFHNLARCHFHYIVCCLNVVCENWQRVSIY